MKSYEIYSANDFVQWLKTAREAIERAIGPDAEDYPDVVRDTLFGEVNDADLDTHRHALLHALAHEDACAKAQEDLEAHYAERKRFHKERANLFREQLIRSVELLGEHSWKSARGFGSVYTMKPKPKVEVIDLDAVPREYLRAEVSTTAVTQALASGKEVAGVRLVPAEERDLIWVVRPSKAQKGAV